jgi:uncharacterized membrane protein YoaK (UPF0700 family)
LSRALVTSSALGFTAGYVDTLGFVALFGLFTAHVTGNFVLIGSEFANPMHGVLIKFLAFPAFIVGVAAARLIAVRIAGRERSLRASLLVLQCVLLAACMLCGWRAQPILDSSAPWVLATGMLGASAMGVQNAAARLAFSDLAPTTVMTGNVTQIVIDLVDLVRSATDDGLPQRIAKFACPLLAFAAGAICGASFYQHASMWGLALPLVILASLALTLPAQVRATS